MFKNLKYILVAVTVLNSSIAVFAGNESKRGQAGATELLINPWARSSGMAGANTAGMSGIESMNFNMGGLAKVRKTELAFANTTWLGRAADVNINTLAFGQKLGDNGGTLGLSIMSVNMGKIEETTEDMPDGTGIYFNPQLTNIAVAYSKIFSKSITGGILVRAISHTAPRISALGVCFDAGLQYTTKLKKESKNTFHFGVGLRNVGPPLKFQGDGLGYRGVVLGSNMEGQSLMQRSNPFEMPSLMNIGASYDFVLVDSVHTLTVASNFNSNSFSRDQLQAGIEYGFKNFLMLRAGLDYQQGILFNTKTSNNVHTGGCFGITLALPYGEMKDKSFRFDFSYRTSAVFSGSYALGISLNL
jgi:hypothetical protein